jgi:hypothetical protein
VVVRGTDKLQSEKRIKKSEKAVENDPLQYQGESGRRRKVSDFLRRFYVVSVPSSANFGKILRPLQLLQAAEQRRCFLNQNSTVFAQTTCYSLLLTKRKTLVKEATRESQFSLSYNHRGSQENPLTSNNRENPEFQR